MTLQSAPVTELQSLGSLAPADGVSFDPYLIWAEISGWKGYFNLPAFDGGSWIPVIAEAAADVKLADLVVPDLVSIASPYLEPVTSASAYVSPYFTALVKRDHLSAFRAAVKRFHIAVPAVSPAAFNVTSRGTDSWFAAPFRWMARNLLFSTISAIFSGQPRPTIAVIDDGCALYNSAFRESSSPKMHTRIRSVWSQGRGIDNASWRLDERFPYGRVIDDVAINKTLDRIARGETTAEQAYIEDKYLVGSTPTTLRSWTHGTAVLDLAAGSNPSISLQTGALPRSECDIRFVHLPEIQANDMSGGGLGVFILDGVRQVLGATPRSAPLVVNVSYGGLAGPHDGTSLLESALDDLLEHRANFGIVLAAGNGRLSKCHWSASLPPGATDGFVWTMAPVDPTDSFLEVWSPTDAEIEVLIGAEQGALQTLAIDSVLRWENHGAPVAMACRFRNSPRGAGQHMLLAVTPQTPPGNGQVASPISWRFKFRNLGQASVDIDAFVERDATFPWSEIAAPEQSTVAPFVATGTLSSIATGARTIVVGGRVVAGGVVDSSGEGPTRSTARWSPDVAAPSQTTPLTGLRCTGVLDGTVALGGWGLFKGTSAAAPLVSRWLADYMADQLSKGSGPMGWKDLQQAVRGRPETKAAPDSRAGYRLMD